MAFSFIFALALVAVACADYAPTAQDYHDVRQALRHNVIVQAAEKYDSHPQYSFAYGVDDKLTGDSKSQIEERDGDVVRGEYSLIDADGYKRTVYYTADDVNGFNAVVEREPLVKSVAVAPVAVKSVAPVINYASPRLAHYSDPFARYAAPTLVNTVEPVADYSASAAHYAAPTVARSYTSPVTRYGAPAAHYTSYAAPLTYANSNPNYATYSSPGFTYHY